MSEQIPQLLLAKVFDNSLGQFVLSAEFSDTKNVQNPRLFPAGGCDNMSGQCKI
jgi:hypothetical protein